MFLSLKILKCFFLSFWAPARWRLARVFEEESVRFEIHLRVVRLLLYSSATCLVILIAIHGLKGR